MKIRTSLPFLLLIPLIMCLLSTTCIAESESWPYPRHTLGFPNVVNKSLENLLLNLTSLHTPVKPRREAIVSENTTQEKIISQAASALGVPASRLRWVLNELPSSRMRSALLKLLSEYYEGKVDEHLLESLMKELLSAYTQGRIDPSAYKAALDIIERISKSSGINYSDLYKLAEKYAGSVPMAQLLHLAKIPAAPTLLATPSINYVSTNLWFVALVLLIAIAGIALTLLLHRYGRRLRVSLVSMASRLGRRVEVAVYGSVVREYWLAVDLLERVLGIRRMFFETHREYLEKLAKAGIRIPPFEELTALYELVRFGHARGQEHEVRARKCLEAVKAWIRSYSG